MKRCWREAEGGTLMSGRGMREGGGAVAGTVLWQGRKKNNRDVMVASLELWRFYLGLGPGSLPYWVATPRVPPDSSGDLPRLLMR